MQVLKICECLGSDLLVSTKPRPDLLYQQPVAFGLLYGEHKATLKFGSRVVPNPPAIRSVAHQRAAPNIRGIGPHAIPKKSGSKRYGDWDTDKESCGDGGELSSCPGIRIGRIGCQELFEVVQMAGGPAPSNADLEFLHVELPCFELAQQRFSRDKQELERGQQRESFETLVCGEKEVQTPERVNKRRGFSWRGGGSQQVITFPGGLR